MEACLSISLQTVSRECVIKEKRWKYWCEVLTRNQDSPFYGGIFISNLESRYYVSFVCMLLVRFIPKYPVVWLSMKLKDIARCFCVSSFFTCSSRSEVLFPPFQVV